jgi:Tol biopolymer transport system component
MALACGLRLGQYEVVAAIGAGGMGEVYRARDLSLGRDVALKVLPVAVAHDPERLGRFEREARLLAALNHPNIAHIYGFQREPGALVMELVEGDTLADRLVHGALPTRDALAIARQIAEGLDAAHEQGIVHRDLKPANIKVRPDGTVKILDFGLAKAMFGEAVAADISHSPTLTVGGTQSGVVLGTAGYMSPEQARGQPVDKRTDVWAFGCVLYEMLTGRSAFTQTTVSDTIVAILEHPPNWAALPSALPDERVRELLERCLAKDRRQRLRDIGDARLEIEHALTNTTRLAPVDGQPAHELRKWLWPALAAVTALVAAVVVTVSWRELRRNEASEARAEFRTGPLLRMTNHPGLTAEPSISRDGRMVAYASNRGGDNLDVWVQQTSGGAAIRVTSDPADDRQPDVAPDGSLITFYSARAPRGIYVVPTLGGDARLVVSEGMGPRFSPDGRSIAYWTGSWLAPHSLDLIQRTFIVPSAGGEPMQVASSLASAGDPIWSPDGRALLLFGRRQMSDETITDWWWVPLSGGNVIQTGVYERMRANGLNITPVDDQPNPKAWTPAGVMFSALDADGEGRSLWRIAIDVATGRATGDPVRMTTGTTADAWPAASQDGRMVFASETVTRISFALPLDANAGRVTGSMSGIRQDATMTGRASVSLDGRLFVAPRYEFGNGSLWVRDMQTGREHQIVATPPTPLNPTTSANGQWVAYTLTTLNMGGNAGSGIGYLISSAGGTPRKICDDCEVSSFTPDEQEVIVLGPDRKTFTRVHTTTGERRPLIEARVNIDRPMVGPNGKWVTFNGGGAIHVAPIHADRATLEDEWVTVLKTNRNTERTAGLSPDGRLLYVLLEPDGFRCLYAIALDPDTGRPKGEPFPVYHFHDASRRWGSTGYGSAAVNGMFLVDLFETTSNLWMTTMK